MDKKEPPDSNEKLNSSQSKPRSKSKTGDRQYNTLPQSSMLYPRPHSYVETQPSSLLRRRLLDAQQSYVPSYAAGAYRCPCDSSCLYGTTSTRRSVYPPPYGYRDTFYSPRALPCAHSSPLRRVALSSPVQSHGYSLPSSLYEPTLCRQSYYESYLRERLRDIQYSLSRSVAPRGTNEYYGKRKVSTAQQTSDRSESEAETSPQNESEAESRSGQSVNYTKYYDPCAGRDRLLNTIMGQMNDPYYEDLNSIDENATEDEIADEADEIRRIERPVRDICEKYTREFSEKDGKKDKKDGKKDKKDGKKDKKDTNENHTGEDEKVNSQTETVTDINSDKDNEEITTVNNKDGVIEATNENRNEIEKETTETKDDAASDKEQKIETKTDENVELTEPVVNKPTVETEEEITHEELVKDITDDIEAQLDKLLENLDNKISDQTTNVLSKYIINTSRGSVVYHMSCASIEHMVQFIINPQFNLDRCQSLPTIDTTLPSSSIQTTLAFPSQSWATFCNHACPKQTTSFSSDAISMYLQQLDISEPQLIAEANNPTPINSYLNSSILGDVQSEMIRNSLEESTEMFAQDLNGWSSSEVQPCTKTVTFTSDS